MAHSAHRAPLTEAPLKGLEMSKLNDSRLEVAAAFIEGAGEYEHPYERCDLRVVGNSLMRGKEKVAYWHDDERLLITGNTADIGGQAAAAMAHAYGYRFVKTVKPGWRLYEYHVLTADDIK